jgi:hypothetical protein
MAQTYHLLALYAAVEATSCGFAKRPRLPEVTMRSVHRKADWHKEKALDFPHRAGYKINYRSTGSSFLFLETRGQKGKRCESVAGPPL